MAVTLCAHAEWGMHPHPCVHEQAHAELTKQLETWLDGYLIKPGVCDHILLHGTDVAEKELRAFLRQGASAVSKLLITPSPAIVPPVVVPLEPVNYTGLCGLALGVPKKGSNDKVSLFLCSVQRLDRRVCCVSLGVVELASVQRLARRLASVELAARASRRQLTNLIPVSVWALLERWNHDV